jgi:geranylgeranylglycerol-phosphate geranylgeranyltransferase
MTQHALSFSINQWRSLIGAARLVRLSNSLPASALVLLGAQLAVGWPLPARAWQAALAMWCVTAFGYVSNDYFDVAEDAINKPDRPIPAGLVSPRGAGYFAGGLALSALGCSLTLGWAESCAALVVLLLLLLYNLRLKSTPGGGNLLIAGLAGCTFMVGSVAVLGFTLNALRITLWPAALLMSFIAAREALKTVEDVVGDRAVGKQTLAIRIGAHHVIRLVALLTLGVIGFSLAPWLYSGYATRYLVLMALGMWLPLGFTVSTLWQNAKPARVSQCLALLKGSYFVGMLAVLLR